MLFGTSILVIIKEMAIKINTVIKIAAKAQIKIKTGIFTLKCFLLRRKKIPPKVNRLIYLTLFGTYWFYSEKLLFNIVFDFVSFFLFCLYSCFLSSSTSCLLLLMNCQVLRNSPFFNSDLASVSACFNY